MELIIALVILGPKRLPAAGRSLGRGMREFKNGLTGSKHPPELDPPTKHGDPRHTPAPAGALRPASAVLREQPTPATIARERTLDRRPRGT
jgi:sec-independent protein translocase protein TatA